MGFLKLFKWFRTRPAVQKLPAGSLTVDREGRVVIATVASDYPADLLHEIAREILRLFREAREAEIPMAEISLYFASLHITARELRGGAIIFLIPQITSTVRSSI